MKFSLSKNKYCFGGRELYFGSIIALPLITSCCYAGLVGTELKTDDDIKHIRCTLYAKIRVAEIIRDKHGIYKCDEWIKQDKYKDSIYNVITKAIADCALGRNEFDKEKINDGIITFENKDYEKYTDENWNALVLYNFINYLWPKTGTSTSGHAYWIDPAGEFYKDIIKSGRLSVACGEKWLPKIKRAYNDIVDYNKQLNLQSLMRSINRILDETLRQTLIPCEIPDKVVYDVGKGYRRRIRYDFDTVPFASSNSNVYEYRYLTIEIANEKLERILAYGKDGVDAIELNNYMEIEKSIKIFDPKKDKGYSDIDLTRKLTDIDPSLMIIWHESDDGIHINKIKYDTRIDDLSAGTTDANFKYTRKIKIQANDKYTPQPNSKHEKGKPIIFEKECFKQEEDEEHRKANCNIDLDLGGINGGVILPPDCKDLFTNNTMIRNITLWGFKLQQSSLAKLCNNTTIEDININIHSAKNLKDISEMVALNPDLKTARIKISDAPVISDMHGLFCDCANLTTVILDIKPNKNHPIDMRCMFWRTDNLKTIKWEDSNWIKRKYNNQRYEYDIFRCHNNIAWTSHGLKKCARISEQLLHPLIPSRLIISEELYYILKEKRNIDAEIENLNSQIEQKKQLITDTKDTSDQNEMISNTHEEISTLERKKQMNIQKHKDLSAKIIDAYKKGYL